MSTLLDEKRQHRTRCGSCKQTRGRCKWTCGEKQQLRASDEQVSCSDLDHADNSFIASYVSRWAIS